MRFILSGLTLLAFAAPAQAQDAAAGKAAFVPCSICHAVEPGKAKLGPSLFGVVGRKVGSDPKFAYSPALKAKGGVWTPAALDAFVAAPKTVVPGNKMAYPGVTDAKKRADLIAYLKTLK
ncbi:c-type cytochrome [Sphingomonas sp. 1P06PA]|uniref:c-type cytochrome n=1 Tax=Sphingomonas sp. 1P06PA TaxID=554121 RepID=UPI0039A718C7